MNVYEKLCHVQRELRAPKNQYNKFGGYNYRSCEDILEGVKPILSEVKAILVISDDIEVRESRYYVKATATFIDCESGEKISNAAYAREEETKKGMDSSQITGSTSSYARKYALNGLLCIDDVKDADVPTSQGNGTRKPKKSTSDNTVSDDRIENNKIDQPKINCILSELKRTGLQQDKLLRMYKVSDIKDFTIRQYIDAMNKFKLTPSKEER